jgi:hypothetical protein
MDQGQRVASLNFAPISILETNTSQLMGFFNAH